MKDFIEDIQIFGREEIREVLIDKLREEKEHYDYLTNLRALKLDALERLSVKKPWEAYIRRFDLDFTLGKKIKQSVKKLEKFSIQYLFLLGKYKKPENRLTDEEIQKAREYPLIDLIDCRPIKSGKNIKILCPFHDEKTPSFYIYLDNAFHCFGCGAHGNNAIDFLSKKEGLTFLEAVRRLL